MFKLQFGNRCARCSKTSSLPDAALAKPVADPKVPRWQKLSNLNGVQSAKLFAFVSEENPPSKCYIFSSIQPTPIWRGTLRANNDVSNAAMAEQLPETPAPRPVELICLWFLYSIKVPLPPLVQHLNKRLLTKSVVPPPPAIDDIPSRLSPNLIATSPSIYFEIIHHATRSLLSPQIMPERSRNCTRLPPLCLTAVVAPLNMSIPAVTQSRLFTNDMQHMRKHSPTHHAAEYPLLYTICMKHISVLKRETGVFIYSSCAIEPSVAEMPA